MTAHAEIQIEPVGCAHGRQLCYNARTCGEMRGHTWDQDAYGEWSCTNCCAYGSEITPEETTK